MLTSASAHPRSNPTPPDCICFKRRERESMMSKVSFWNIARCYDSMEQLNGNKDKRNFKLTMGRQKPSGCSLINWCLVCSSLSFQKRREGLCSLALQLLHFLNCYLLREDQLNQPSCNWQLAFKIKSELTNNVAFFFFNRCADTVTQWQPSWSVDPN